VQVLVSNFKVEKVKTWTTLFTFFWHDTSKKRKSRAFLDYQKKNV